MFKDKFEELLTKTGTTIYQLSKATGISTGQLSDYKVGRSSPKIDTCIKIADYFGLTLDELAEHSPIEPKEKSRLSQQETLLIDLFRQTSKEGRLEMIAAFVEIKKKWEHNSWQ